MALTADDLQDEAQEAENGAAFVYHVDPIAGDNTQLGKCWRGTSDGPKKDISAVITHAAANFANRPIAIRFNGPIALGTGSRITLQTTNLGPGALRGIGRYASISGGIENGPVIWAASNWELSDFRMISTVGVDKYSYLVGDAGSQVTQFAMRRMIFDGITDVAYFAGPGSAYDCYDSLLNSKWDTHFNEGVNIIARFWRCFLNSLGPHTQSAAAHVQGAGQSVSGALTQLFNCAVSFRATNSDAQRQAYGLHTQSGGAIELHGTSVICSVPDGGLVDLEADSPSEFRVASNCSFNLKRSLAGSSGTITYDYGYPDVRAWGGDSSGIATDAHGFPKVDVEDAKGVAVTPITSITVTAVEAINGTAPAGSLPALADTPITAAVNYPFAQPISLTNFDASAWTKIIFTVKANRSDADSAAKLTIQITNPGSGGDGLQLLNGAAPVSPVVGTDGFITVTTATTTALTCTPTLTARGMGIAAGSYFWELVVYASGIKQSWLGSGQFLVSQTLQQAVT